MPSFANHFADDTEFAKLLAKRRDVDLTTAALEIARDAEPGLDFDIVRSWIADRGREVSGAIGAGATETEALAILAHHLAEEHGLNGDEASYESPTGSYLNTVLETGRGLPITLSLAYMAVGSEVGLSLEGVSAPMRFLARLSHEDVFIDAYAGGRLMNDEECVYWLQAMTGLPREEVTATFRPATPRAIIVRMLNNLKTIHCRREDWGGAQCVQERLAALWPTSLSEQRDLAVILHRTGQSGRAIDLLRGCIRRCNPEERGPMEDALHDAEQVVARWN